MERQCAQAVVFVCIGSEHFQPHQGPVPAPLGAHLEDGLLHEPRQNGVGAQGGHAAVLAQNPVRQRGMPYNQLTSGKGCMQLMLR